jgi:hypothetical protein
MVLAIALSRHGYGEDVCHSIVYSKNNLPIYHRNEKGLLIRISIALSMAYDIVSRVYANPVKEFMTLVQGNLKDRQNVITGSESGRYIMITI